jgi:DNA topoisomerase-2
MECQILITEGESARSQITQARDPRTTAAFALTGKINNVYGTTPAQALKMGKITELLAAIGLTPGKKATVGDLNYGKIVIATDADFDGDDIFTLLINLFHHFWPELFDKKNTPVVYRLIAPNVCLAKGKQRIHFPRRSDYDKVKDKYSGYEVRYYKGLGSMAKEDWEMVLSGKTDTLIPFYDDGMMEGALTLLFSDNSEARKKWLTVE